MGRDRSRSRGRGDRDASPQRRRHASPPARRRDPSPRDQGRASRRDRSRSPQRRRGEAEEGREARRRDGRYPAEERRRPSPAGDREAGRDRQRDGRRDEPRDRVGRRDEFQEPPPRSQPPPQQQGEEPGRGWREQGGGGEGRGWGGPPPPRHEGGTPPGAGRGRGRGRGRRRGGGDEGEGRQRWGNDEVRKQEEEEAQPDVEVEPEFGLSGALAAEANTVKGVVLVHTEPPEARKPTHRWRLYVFKKGQPLDDPLHIHRQSCYLFGRERRVADVPTDHPSCSKQHAVLQYRLTEKEGLDGMMHSAVRPYIMDLGSTNGTHINNERIEPQRYYELLNQDMLRFGNSSREYVLIREDSAK